MNINLYDYLRALGKLADNLHTAKNAGEQSEDTEQLIMRHVVKITSLIVHSIGVPAALQRKDTDEIEAFISAQLGDDLSPEPPSVFTVNDILEPAEIEAVKFAYRTTRAAGGNAVEAIIEVLQRTEAESKLAEHGVSVIHYGNFLDAQLYESYSTGQLD